MQSDRKIEVIEPTRSKRRRKNRTTPSSTTINNPTRSPTRNPLPHKPSPPPPPSSPSRQENPVITKTTKQTTTFTLRDLPYTYIHLSLIHPPTAVAAARVTASASASASALAAYAPALDILTAHAALQSALSRFLGLHGAAISVDILHVVAETAEFWIRVPRLDGDQVVAAVVGWIGRDGQVLRVKGRGDWLGGLVMGGRGGGIGKDVWKE